MDKCKIVPAVKRAELSVVIRTGSLAFGGLPIPENEQEEQCKQIVRDINRHVDLDGATMEIARDYTYQCPLCGYLWSADDDGYNWCCEPCCKPEEEIS